jgi:hypothetical protein
MSKPRVIIQAVAVVAVLGGLIWWTVATRPPAVPDPVYAGHPVSFWVGVGVQNLPRSVDSNAVPYLLDALKRRDGPLRTAWINLWGHLPGWLTGRVARPISASEVRFNSCGILAALASHGRPAIPELIRILREDDDSRVRLNAASALGELAGREDEAAVEALAAAANNDRGPGVDIVASGALSHINWKAATKAGVANAPPVAPPTNPAGVVR